MGDIEERGGRKSGLRECGEKESRVSEWGRRWGLIKVRERENSPLDFRKYTFTNKAEFFNKRKLLE